MATQQDLDLVKRLMGARILDEQQLRGAFDLQAQLHAQGKKASIVAVLYHLELLPRGSLDALRAPSVLVGQPFEGYRLEARVGTGGSGDVYRGVYTPNGAPVALKVFDPVQALRADFLERFQQEAEILIELEHENIVPGYEVGFAAGLHFFSMELIDGLTVLEVVDRRGFLSNEEGLSITLQAARGLEYLHTNGYLHRDIKPGNLMVDASGRVRMIDLGLIRHLSDADVPASSESSTTVGTVAYFSPEQARGRADLDPRSDIYSLGVSLYHMVVGDVPFHGDDDYEVMAKQVLSAMDTQKVKQRRISPEVHFFITKMTSKERDRRFGTVEEVIATLEGYLPSGVVPVDLGPPRAAKAAAVAPIQKPRATPLPPPPPVAKPVRPAQDEPAPPGTPQGDGPRPAPAPAPTRARQRGRSRRSDASRRRRR